MSSDDLITCSVCNISGEIAANNFICCHICRKWFHNLCVPSCDNIIEKLEPSYVTWTCYICKSEEAIPPSQDISDLVPCPLCPNNDAKFFKGRRGLRIHWTRAHPLEPFELLTTSFSNNLKTSFNTILTNCKINIRVLKRIPKGARRFAADRLNQVIQQCLTTNSEKHWQDLMLFAYIALHVPNKSNKCHDKSLISKIKDNLRNFTMPPTSTLTKKQSSLSRIIENKVSDGDVRGALRILSSPLGVADNNQSTFEQLSDKHPPPSRSLHFPEPPVLEASNFTFSEDSVLQVIRNFPNGSASGIDGLRPQHLKDLTSISAGDSGRRLLENITRLCNRLLCGDVSDNVHPYLFGASLIALKKKDGGLRPIAIGNTFRRIAAKLACSSVRDNLGDYFRPHQLGFGTPKGCEAIIHTVRTFLNQSMNNCTVLLKIDLKNAFNCVERDLMLKAVQENVPQLYPFLWRTYREPSNLYFNDKIILSQRGAQQGDPTGPMIFSLAIHPIISKLMSKLNLFYLDDGILGDEPETVLRDFQTFVEECASIGLEINPNKCELYFSSTTDQEVVNSFQKIAPGIKIILKKDLTILGSPIMIEAIDIVAQKHREVLHNLFDGLNLVSTHIAYFLLKNCFLVPKMTYFLRTTPMWLFPSFITEIDDMVRNVLETILNLTLDEKNWLFASLPVRFGGLGVRKITDICLPAFLASANGVFDFVKSVLLPTSDEFEISHLAEATAAWTDLNPDQAFPTFPFIQKQWDQINASRLHHLLLASSPSTVDQARYLALQENEASAWLRAIPSTHLGTLMDNTTFRLAVGLRLGCKISCPHSCLCGSPVDCFGHHGLSCIKSAGRHSRHFMINDLLKRALVSADIPSILEPVGISRSDGKRPDGLSLIPWSKGKSLLWDATCVDTLAPSYLIHSSKHSGSAANMAVTAKKNKYKHIIDNYHFVAFAVETLGPWSREAKELTLELGRRLRNTTGEPRSKEYLIQQISIAIQRGNAASIMGTFPENPSLGEFW